MLGAITGDIVGSRFEFSNIQSKEFDLFVPECGFTDDTICTVALADAIVRNRSYKDSLLYWCNRHPYPMGGYGGSFARWINSMFPRPYYSYGNGSAMRVSSIGWISDSISETIQEAEKSARCTHDHPEGIKGAVSVAHAIWYLRRCAVPQSWKDGIIQVGNKYYPGFQDMKFTPGIFDESCQGTVPLCFQILLQANGFEDALRLAVSHGGDSDTIAAIVGSMAEPIWGIPKKITAYTMMYLTQDMKSVVSEFQRIVNYKEYKPVMQYE